MKVIFDVRTEEENMKCPNCQTEMKGGQVTAHGTASGPDVAGPSQQHYWFEIFERSEDEQVIVKSDGKRAAYYCPKCPAVLIDDTDPEPDGPLDSSD